MFITSKTEWTKVYSIFHQILEISDNGWRRRRQAWRPCSPSPNIPKATWVREKVVSKNIHRNTRIISLAFGLETESFLQIKVLPNLLGCFHLILECVKTMRFTATYYIETSNHHRHFLGRKVTLIYKE